MIRKILNLSFLPVLLIGATTYADCSNGMRALDISYIHIAEGHDVDLHEAYSLVRLHNGEEFRFHSPAYPNENDLGFSWQCYGFVGTSVSQLPKDCGIGLSYKGEKYTSCECNNKECKDMKRW